MKYTTEEIKEMLKGFSDLLAENERLTAKLGFYDNKCPVCNSTLGLLHADACPLCAARKEVERLQEDIEQLRVQLAACGVAAMCNTKQSRRQQKCVVGDYGWSQSYQDVVNAVGREIALRDQLQAAQAENERLSALAAQHLADQDYLCAKERKRVARECAEIADSNADEYQDEMNIYPDGDPKVEVYEKAMVACEYIAKEIRTRYGVEG